MNRNILLQKIISSSKDGIHIVDEQGISFFYNRRMSVMENRPTASILGKRVSETENLCDSNLLWALETGFPQVNKIHTGMNRFGNKVLLSYSVWPISQQGRIIGAVKIAADITELRQLRDKVLGATKDINSLMQKEGRKGAKGRRSLLDMVGESEQMEEIRRIIYQASQCDANVLIIGESGTGKELIAQSIHSESSRRNREVVAENCAAIPPNLMESVLFGTVKGGFTGAVDRPGLFQMADGGTLILDEVNSLSAGLQAKLLRVLQEGVFHPVGENQQISVNVRVIAIVNEDPELLIREGRLREDLFYRLSVINIWAPPLTQRKGDLHLLAGHFLKQYSQRNKKEVSGFSDEVWKAFRDHSWKGNVRELSNVIECGVNLVEPGGAIQFEHLPYYFLKGIQRYTEKAHVDAADAIDALEAGGIEEGWNLNDYIAEVERSLIQNALTHWGGNVSKAAESLGITRQTLQYKLRRLDQ